VQAEIEFDGRQIARRYIDKNYPNIKELHKNVQTPEQLEVRPSNKDRSLLSRKRQFWNAPVTI
jgi:hypothetical protein